MSGGLQCQEGSFPQCYGNPPRQILEVREVEDGLEEALGIRSPSIAPLNIDVNLACRENGEAGCAWRQEPAWEDFSTTGGLPYLVPQHVS